MFTLEEFVLYFKILPDTRITHVHGIVCRTEIEIRECCEWLNSMGLKWRDGTNYDGTIYNDVMCFCNDGGFIPGDGSEGLGSYVDMMEWSVLKREIIQEPDLLDSDSLDAMLKDIEVY